MHPRRRQLLIAVTAIAASHAFAQSGYEPPLRANDLAPDERYSAKIPSDTTDTQLRAKDIGARRLGAGNVWSPLKADKTDDTVLANWVVYGKPFYAMAPGVVVAGSAGVGARTFSICRRISQARDSTASNFSIASGSNGRSAASIF